MSTSYRLAAAVHLLTISSAYGLALRLDVLSNISTKRYNTRDTPVPPGGRIYLAFHFSVLHLDHLGWVDRCGLGRTRYT
ncbi:hypothetical protein QBC47DRAFT_395918 [Echria macrotheca]|uniref:Uncharacterized protein n=1 Tax=Echria macrotheca TaxID=438768 RepID=A0AAJ0F5N5_9PEZI|nr:hypothetical protein QBC47DRAFT_395918 [Echria macrotheca]